MNIKITTPQFQRPAGEPGPALPLNAEAFDDLDEMDPTALRELGLIQWNEPGKLGGDMDVDDVLWLFPAEWYDHIPEGFDIVDINGFREKFVRGETDDDIRFGMLSYGIVQNRNVR
jgi:hypothetical protein